MARWRKPAAFTLIELLTVLAIIAVLASLLLTAVISAKKKAQIVVCTSNLHQFSLALDLYLNDWDGKRPSVDDLVSGRYLSSPQTLICPADKTGNWGRLVQTGSTVVMPGTNQDSVHCSYLVQPLYWNEAEWKQIVKAGNLAGIAACQLHGLGNQKTPNIHNYSGLLLRAQLDGSVIRRQFFWSLPPSLIGSAMASSLGNGLAELYPLQIFFDDPTNWQGFR